MAAIDRAMHLFELHWPDIMSQAHFPRYLRAALIVLLSNPAPTLLKLYKLLTDDTFRSQQLAVTTDESVRQFWRNYDELSASAKRQQIDPLLARLESFKQRRIPDGWTPFHRAGWRACMCCRAERSCSW